MTKFRQNGKALKTSKKDFKVRSKSYTTPEQALNELVTNAFFAPKANKIKFIINNYKDTRYLAVMNNGESLNNQNLDSILSTYGCDSAKTAGNENGTGVKTTASYFTSEHSDSFLMMISKSSFGECSVGLISSEGEYFIGEDNISDSDIEFRDFLYEKYLINEKEGCITAVYNPSHFDEFSLESYRKTINDMLTTGLNRIDFNIEYYDNIEKITYVDECYLDNTNESIFRHNFDTSFTWNVNGKNKIFCSIINCVDTHEIENHMEFYNHFDEVYDGIIHTYGLMCGYDNGYMPMYTPSVYPLGLAGKQQYFRTRAYMYADTEKCDKLNKEASDKGEEEVYATISDWKAFYSTFGRMSATKIPDYSKPFNFMWDGKPKAQWESFYNAVIMPIRKDFMAWMPQSDKDALKEEEDREKAESIRRNMHFKMCDTTFTFNIDTIGDSHFDDLVEYVHDDKGNRLINFNANSPKLKGKNEKETRLILTGYFDMMKMICQEKNSVGDIEKSIRKICKKLNAMED